MFDVIYINDKYTQNSLLYYLVMSFDLLKCGGILIVGKYRALGTSFIWTFESVVEIFITISANEITKWYNLSNQVIVIKA